MHEVVLSEEILARARLTRGGRDHLFDRLDVARTAHVVVDMQFGFVSEHSPMGVAAARDTIDNINAISRAVRASGGTNVFLRFAYDPDEPVAKTQLQEGIHLIARRLKNPRLIGEIEWRPFIGAWGLQTLPIACD